MGTCDLRDTDTYFSDLPNVWISMISPLLPVKATPILKIIIIIINSYYRDSDISKESGNLILNSNLLRVTEPSKDKR